MAFRGYTHRATFDRAAWERRQWSPPPGATERAEARRAAREAVRATREAAQASQARQQALTRLLRAAQAECAERAEAIARRYAGGPLDAEALAEAIDLDALDHSFDIAA